MAFEPSFVKIAPGDTVKFLSTDKARNDESFKGMLPDGAKPSISKDGEAMAVKLEREGVFGVKCLPH